MVNASINEFKVNVPKGVLWINADRMIFGTIRLLVSENEKNAILE